MCTVCVCVYICVIPVQVARAANALVPFTPEGVEKSHSEHDDDDDSLASSSPYRHPLSQEEVASLSSPALPSKRQVYVHTFYWAPIYMSKGRNPLNSC
jgi:hypothetical protein